MSDWFEQHLVPLENVQLIRTCTSFLRGQGYVLSKDDQLSLEHTLQALLAVGTDAKRLAKAISPTFLQKMDQYACDAAIARNITITDTPPENIGTPRSSLTP